MTSCRFAVTDEKGAVAPSASVLINLCHCSSRGDCLFGKRASGQKVSAMFRIVACNCSTGWTGEELRQVTMERGTLRLNEDPGLNGCPCVTRLSVMFVLLLNFCTADIY